MGDLRFGPAWCWPESKPWSSHFCAATLPQEGVGKSPRHKRAKAVMDEKDASLPPTRVEASLRDHPTLELQIKGQGPPGWDEHVVQALTEIAALAESTGTTVRIEQIKEKFGGLRIHVFVDEPSATGFKLVDSKPG